MAKLKISDLAEIKDRVTRLTSLREGGAKVKVTVHMGTCGIAAGARNALDAVMDELEKSGRKDIVVSTSGCRGQCGVEPLVTVERPGEAPVNYSQVDDPKMRQIFLRHVMEGAIQNQWVLAEVAQQPLEQPQQ
jgi:NADP-reducing hydrogenase subunit HndB